jgi:transcriptional regulator with PAS, ATPase and Fis domain
MEHILIGEHPSIKKIHELINLVADTGYSVLLQGETGTGKEVVARLLHAASSRCHQRFIKVSCAALPLTLLESELFGYEKGAFTGADKFKPGKFELASEGVIFLDEIGDMPQVVQAKLLQVLQSGEFSRLGGTREVSVNAWVISSSHHNLEEDMKRGLFREDLYYRLNIIKIELPPLRERREDIPLLIEHFMRKYQAELKVDEPFNLHGDVSRLFQTYHWPGNVRELSSIILKLMLDDGPEIVISELLENMKVDDETLPADYPVPFPDMAEQDRDVKRDLDNLRSLKDVKAEARKYIERKAITHALNRAGWNKREAAKKMNDYGIKK